MLNNSDIKGCFSTTTGISEALLKCSTGSLRVHSKCDQHRLKRVRNFLKLCLSFGLGLAEAHWPPRPQEMSEMPTGSQHLKKREPKNVVSLHKANHSLFTLLDCAKRANVKKETTEKVCFYNLFSSPVVMCPLRLI